MEYLKLFETETEYNNEASGLIYPTVSYINDTDTVYFMQKTNHLIATYNVTSTSSSTDLLGAYFSISQVSEMYVDDAQVTPSKTYIFSTTGNHKVKMVFKDNFNSCQYLFYGCTGLTSIDFSNFDTSKVTNMYNMLYRCAKLTSLDLSNLDTSKVTDMRSMFQECTGLTSVKMLGPTNTSADVAEMFTNVNTTGTFYYNDAYDYRHIIAKLPSTWTAVAV